MILRYNLNKFSLVYLLIIISGIFSYAQDFQLHIDSFILEENSLTAKNEPVYDNNNQKCALVIITGMGKENLRFDTGNSFVKIEEKIYNGERAYLMWLSEGTIRVKISSDSKNFEPIEYYFNPRVKKSETYLMTLKLEELKNNFNKQYLEFLIEPKNATLEINNELWILSDGIAYKQLPKGKYQYQVKAKNYHSETGLVDFVDLNNKKTVIINLKPNFGWLTINDKYDSSIILFIDDEAHIGSLNKIQLSSGRHNIKIAKELYQPEIIEIIIADNQETIIEPNLKPNFSTININIEEGGDIYLDNKFVGSNAWTGSLGIGEYKVEIKKKNYSSLTETIDIKDIGETLKFDYKALKPINGSLIVETTPPHAVVKIDDKIFGETPLIIPELLIGNHKVFISLDGYSTLNNDIEIIENEETKLSVMLNKIEEKRDQILTENISKNDLPSANIEDNNSNEFDLITEKKEEIIIQTVPQGANLYVDGKFIGNSPHILKNDKRNHTLRIVKPNYSEIKEYLMLDNDITYNLIKEDEVMIYSFPPRAQLYLDNHYIGETPCAIKKDSRSHTLSINKNGYFKIVENIDLTGGKNLIFNLKKIDEKTRYIYDPKIDDYL